MNKFVYILFFIISSGILFQSCDDSPTDNYRTIPSFVNEKELGHDLKLTSEISGDYRDRAVVVVSNSFGELGDITLDMDHLSYENAVFYDDDQEIKIYFIEMTPPTQYVPGTIYAECEFSNEYGSDWLIFNGLIASWTLP